MNDLIDTLWNVKQSCACINNAAVLRFNRYIVECKGVLLPYHRCQVCDLIDTLWNVKWHMDESRKHLLIKR